MSQGKKADRPDGRFGDEKLTGREKAFLIAREAAEMKAREIVILDVRDAVALADYFVIGTGDTKRHLRALASKVEDLARENGFAVHHTEGFGLARWILVDLNNVVVHFFDGEAREFYELERLWGDAPTVPLD